MKKKLSRILGVGLTVALLTSLILIAAPVSAGTLSWTAETIPDSTNNVVSAVDVVDIAVAADGNIIYAGGGGSTLYKSSDRGKTWSAVDFYTATGNTTDLVAVAPDDSNIVVVADTGTNAVWVTVNGGTTWGSLGVPTGITTTKDIAISAASAGIRYLAVAGNDGTNAKVVKWNLGAAAPSWTVASALAGFGASTANTTAVALAYSPSFPSDQVLAVVTAYWNPATDATDSVYLELFSENSDVWNTNAGFASYPAVITSDTGITGVTSASIALGPDYMGSDDSMRLAFIGLNLLGDLDKNGIHRMDDILPKELKVGSTVDINSVAYNGSVLVAGEYGSNTCYYSSDPLATTPTVTTTRAYKRPGIDGDGGSTKVVVAWAGSDVVAGVSTKGAFSVSTTNGASFNDISLVDNLLSDLTDVAVSSDGTTVYLLADDGTDVSLWRKQAGAWQRVLAFTPTPSTADFIVRSAPDDPNKVYVAQKSGTAIYYSADAGQTRWQVRTCNVSIEDLAVEGKGEVAYALTSGGRVAKSTNAGFTWADSVSTLLDNGNMIVSVGVDKLLVGGTLGYVSYSTNGNVSWTKIIKQIGDTSSEVSVTASGLASGDFIYAALESASAGIYRWQIGTSTTWSTIRSAYGSAYTCYGIGLKSGALYVSTANTTDSKTFRTLNPSETPTAYVDWSELNSTKLFNTEPQGLRVSSGKLWVINSETADTLYSYTDTLAAVAPTLTSPVKDYTVKVNPITGYAMDIVLCWTAPSTSVTGYETRIALDSAFTQTVKTITTSSASPAPSQPVGKDVTGAAFAFMPGDTYFWKTRVAPFTADSTAYGPIYSLWSETRRITITAAEAPVMSVTVEPAPAPEITVPAPQVTVNVPPAAAPIVQPMIPAYLLWVIICIGVVLVIALIVLIVRTRRVV